MAHKTIFHPSTCAFVHTNSVLRGSASSRQARDMCALVADASPCDTLADLVDRPHLAGADHMSPMLRPQEVLAAIREFCARVESPSRAGMAAHDNATASPRGAVASTVV